MIITIMYGTPIYIWGLLIYLVIIGWQATKTRKIWVPKLFIIPVVLTLLKYQKLMSIHNVSYTLMPWAIGILIGSYVALNNKTIQFLKDKHAIQLKGSYTTLIMLLTLFSLRYSMNVLKVIYPTKYTSYGYLDTVIVLLFAGYSLGKASTYTMRYLMHRYKF